MFTASPRPLVRISKWLRSNYRVRANVNVSYLQFCTVILQSSTHAILLRQGNAPANNSEESVSCDLRLCLVWARDSFSPTSWSAGHKPSVWARMPPNCSKQGFRFSFFMPLDWSPPPTLWTDASGFSVDAPGLVPPKLKLLSHPKKGLVTSPLQFYERARFRDLKHALVNTLPKIDLAKT